MGSKGSNRSTLYPKIAVILLAIAFLFHLIAIGAPHWASVNIAQRYEHMGLWKYCSYPYGGGESCDEFVNIIYGDWLKAAEAFWIFGLMAVPAALGVVAIYAFADSVTEKNPFMICVLAMAVTGFAGLMNLISICSFGTRFQEYFNNRDPINWAGKNVGQLDWAFGLAATDTVLCFVSLGLLIASVVEEDNNY